MPCALGDPMLQTDPGCTRNPENLQSSSGLGSLVSERRLGDLTLKCSFTFCTYSGAPPFVGLKGPYVPEAKAADSAVKSMAQSANVAMTRLPWQKRSSMFVPVRAGGFSCSFAIHVQPTSWLPCKIPSA